MPNITWKVFCNRLQIMPVFAIALMFSVPVVAEQIRSESDIIAKPSEDKYNVAVGIGALTIIGQDFRLLIREVRSPWVIAARYLNIKDDFVNEAAVGLPNDQSDKVYTQRIGAEVDYLFSPGLNGSFYVGGGFFSTTKELKCLSESDSVNNAGPFIGGGYIGKWRKGFGYQLGFLFSPTAGSTLKTTYCKSEDSGEIDINASLIFGF